MIMFSTVMGEWHEHWLTLRGEGVGGVWKLLF